MRQSKRIHQNNPKRNRRGKKNAGSKKIKRADQSPKQRKSGETARRNKDQILNKHVNKKTKKN